MYAIKGYFNGKKLIPLERADLKPNQKVIITILDEYMDKDDQETNNKKIAAIEAVNGLLKDEETEKITEFDTVISERARFARKVNV